MLSLFLACPNSAYEARIRHVVGGPMWTSRPLYTQHSGK